MSTSETPMTDLEILENYEGPILVGGYVVVKASFARKLEHALTVAKAEIERLKTDLNWWKCEVQTPEQIQNAISFLQSEGQKHDDEFNYEEFMRLTNLTLTHCKALTSSRDAWKKMAGNAIDTIFLVPEIIYAERKNLLPFMYKPVVEIKAAYEKLLKEHGG